ncbi:hypothetical protein ACLOJK_002880 [Asimina triloba]
MYSYATTPQLASTAPLKMHHHPILARDERCFRELERTNERTSHSSMSYEGFSEKLRDRRYQTQRCCDSMISRKDPPRKLIFRGKYFYVDKNEKAAAPFRLDFIKITKYVIAEKCGHVVRLVESGCPLVKKSDGLAA